jgi:hypothetical protein
MLPAKQKSHKIRRNYRLDFPAQSRDRSPVNASQKTAVTPFFFRHG